MKRAGVVGLIGVVIAVVIWTARDGDDPPRSTVTYRDQRTALAPRRAPVRDIDPIAASADDVLRLDGRVIGPDGQAVGGATVVLESTASRTATTAADGHFLFTRVEPQPCALFATAGDLVAGPIQARGPGHPRSLVIRLARGGFRTVIVIDGAGRPIAGAQVHVPVAGRSAIGSTDAAGKAKLGPVQPGFVAIAVDAPGYALGAATIFITSSMPEDETTIILGRGSPMSGRVVDENHDAVAGARITATGAGRQTARPAVSDDRGAFVIPALIRGTYTLQAADDEHAAARSLPVVMDGAPLDGVEIVMRDGGVISGVVLDGDRRPAPFARISASGSAGPDVVADQNGAFELRGLARSFFLLRAETATATSRGVQVDLSEKPEAEVEIVLENVGMISGTVVDERGAPLAGMFVTVGTDWSRSQTAAYREAITDGDGKFVLVGLVDIPYLLEAQRRKTFERSRQHMTARVGDRDIVIKMVPPGQITGRVVIDQSDAPPSHAIVTLWQGMFPVNRDGSFQITDVPPGAHWLSFQGPDFIPFNQPAGPVQSGATLDLGTIRVPRSRTLFGRVVDSSGAPVGGAQVEVGVIRAPPIEVDDPPAGFKAYRSAVAAPDGTFRVNHVPPAPMIAIASAPPYVSSEGVAVPGGPSAPGDPPPVTLVLSTSRGP